MPAPTNHLKKALQQGKTTFGCWMGLTDPTATEIIGQSGFDWVLLDGEHAPYDLRAMTTQLQILDASPSHAAVRVPVGDTRILKQVLDAGAQTVLVPMVESADQARQLVRDVTYPPHGDRGVGYGVARAGAFGAYADYGTTADAEICLMVQVENRAGLAALDDILSIDGIHGVFIGPADLAADLGHMGDLDHEDVQTAIKDALRRIDAAGKIPGFLSLSEAMTRTMLDAGARFVCVASDVVTLSATSRATAAKWITDKR